MLGVLVNTGTVLLGGLIGLLLKRGIPDRITNSLMTGIGLCTIVIGMIGAFKGQNQLIMILSVALGGAVGTLLHIQDGLERFSNWINSRVNKSGKLGSVAQGFMTGSMLFCIGSMTIVGSLQSGLTGDNTMIFTKSTLDLISSFALSASLGVGVIFSAAFVFVFQGALVLLAQFIAPLFTEVVIAEVTCAGSVLIVGLGLNLIGVTKIKVADFLPAIFLPMLFCLFM